MTHYQLRHLNVAANNNLVAKKNNIYIYIPHLFSIDCDNFLSILPLDIIDPSSLVLAILIKSNDKSNMIYNVLSNF
jgi:hypothetical protein